MGALTIASVSTFTSCKDYDDDDINMNTSQIKDLQEQLKTLQTALDQAKNDEVVEVGLAVASGAMDYEALLAWVRAHRV